MEEPNDSQGYGKVMAILTWVLGLIFLTLFFNHWFNKNKMPTEVEIVTTQGQEETILKRNANNQYVAKGLINGKEVTFLLDTGATDVVIPGKLAAKLNLINGSQSIAGTAGGSIMVYDTTIKELVIGHIHLNNINASINPSMHSDEILLGMSALRRIHFVQDDDTMILSFKKSVKRK